MACQLIQASVLHGAKDLRVETRQICPPKPGEIQVAVRATGLCGSDLHYYNHYRNGDIIVREPLSLGHESAGVVVALGEGTHSTFKLGDKVALEVGLPCEKCDRCQEGRYNICKDMRFRSSAKGPLPHAQGTLQQLINHPARWSHKLPDQMPLELGALLEPLSVAIHAVRRAQLEPQSKILVFGAGAVGLLVCAVATMANTKNVTVVDVDSGRLNFALKHKFASFSFLAPVKKPKDFEEEVQMAQNMAIELSRVGNGEFDAAFDCTGVPSCVKACIYATRPGGKVLLIGMGVPVQKLSLSSAALREVDLLGVFRYVNTYSEGIELLSRKGLDLPRFKSLITHRFRGLDSLQDAFELAATTKDSSGRLVLKVLVELQDQSSPKL